jgi:hypothetical protein
MERKELKTAFIFDIDGVIARGEIWTQYKKQIEANDFSWFADRMAHFRPFRWSVEVVRALSAEHTILFVTARNESFRKKTVDWLNYHVGIKSYKLLMRTQEEADAGTKDSEVKKRIFNEKIYGRYDVLAAFDDQRENITLWRSFGLEALHNKEEETVSDR